jgi:hypothetical protein
MGQPHILQNCHDAMPPSGKLFAIERRLDPDHRKSGLALLLDMQMLVTLGGRDRTDEEYRLLFAAAGFELRRIAPLDDAAGFAAFGGTPLKRSLRSLAGMTCQDKVPNRRYHSLALRRRKSPAGDGPYAAPGGVVRACDSSSRDACCRPRRSL